MKNKLILSLLVFYTFYRLYHLLDLNIFLDEALYLRMVRDGLMSQNYLISFADGKEPLFFWLQLIIANFFGLSLFNARLVSVLSGILLGLGIYKLGEKTGGVKVGLMSLLFYVLSPFFFFYNRLAILDTLLTTTLTFLVLGLFQLSRGSKFKILAGVALGLSLITKTISQFYLFLVPLFVLVNPSKKLIFRSLTVLIVGTLIYFLITLAPGFEKIAIKNQIFAYPISQAVLNIKSVFLPNIKTSLRYWMVGYFGLPMMMVFVLGIVLGFVRHNKKIIYLALVSVIGWTGMSFIAKIFFPRYLLFIGVPILIVSAYMINWVSLKNRLFGIVACSLILATPLLVTNGIISNVNSARIPEIERWQYIYGWPSGNCLTSVDESISRSLDSGETLSIPNEGIGEYLKLKLPSGTYRVKDALSTIQGVNVLNYYEETPDSMVNLIKSNGVCQQFPKIINVK